ncbi:MAG: hypothetical protein KAW12_19870 [Candidatus Aminicenantes bacterium]|nr:hypothetical protein [Candidatus Aminicenantes bacterium]
MKVKTSITLSEGLLNEIDRMLEYSGNRSLFIEEAIKDYIERNKRDARDRIDLELINNSFDELNKEAGEVLAYQVDN